MTLIFNPDLVILNDVIRSRFSNVRTCTTPTGQTDRQTDRCDRMHYHVAFWGGYKTMTTTAENDLWLVKRFNCDSSEALVTRPRWMCNHSVPVCLSVCLWTRLREKSLSDFYSAPQLKHSFASAVYDTANPSIRPSVRLSYTGQTDRLTDGRICRSIYTASGIVSKWGNTKGCSLRHRIAQCFKFSGVPRMADGERLSVCKIWVQRGRPPAKQPSCTHLAS